jgi:Tfp pilus assembly protein PilP
MKAAMKNATLALAVSVALAYGGAAHAQQQPQQPPAEGLNPDAAKESLKDLLDKELALQPGQYTYQPGGRRDPFISLLVNVGPSEAPKTRPPGMQGFLIQELALKGIVKDQTGYIAMLLGTDGKSYFARIGQRFYDGVITTMDGATVTFRQDVTDPLSPVKTRDVKKSLYSSEEARQ